MTPAPLVSAPAVDPQNPWLGLASFTEETRAYFHGRDEEVAELGRRVQRKLLTILFGQSGLGKTSILRAGLVPRLRPEGYCPVYVRLDYGRESPPPSEQIKQAILRTTATAGNWSQPGVSQTGETLWEFLHHRDDVLRDDAGRTLIPLLIFDQFEEIFTLAQGDDFGRQRAAQFAEDLADLVENRAPKALEAKLDRDEAAMERFDFSRSDYRILIALREDYLAHLEGLKARMPSVTQNRMRLARMTGAQALTAVTGPGGKLVNDEMAQAIVRFIGGGTELERAEVEPSLLSLVCRELNTARLAQGRAEISPDLLAGSRDTILSEFYERTLADQPAGVRTFVEDELLTDSGYRESLAEERVKKGFVAAGASAESLAALVDRRLLRVEERLDVRRVELTHDVLCGVVRASRAVRHERESKAAIERQLAATLAKEATTQAALFRARMIAAACAVLAIGAAGSAIFGYTSMKRAQLAEHAARTAAAAAKQAESFAEAGRTQAEDLLGFVVSDLSEELTAFGQLPLLVHVTQKAVAYYEGMPAAMRTPASRAAQGRALANLGSVLGVQGDHKGSRERIEHALTLFAALEKEGDLTPAMRLAYAEAQYQLVRRNSSDAAHTEAVAVSQLAEQMLTPVLADPQLGGAATALLADLLGSRGFSLQPAEAVPVYQRAIAVAHEADRLTGRPRPGLVAAREMTWMADAMNRSNRGAESRAALEQARAQLREFVQKEPFLVVALRTLGVAAIASAGEANSRWDFPAMEAAANENQEIYRQLLKLDPKNTTYLNNLAVGNTQPLLRHLREGDVAGYNRYAAASNAGLEFEGASNFSKDNAAEGYLSAAANNAAFGREPEVPALLARGQALVKELRADQSGDSAERVLAEESWRGYARRLPTARLDWVSSRREAEATLARLDREEAGAQNQEVKRDLERAASLDLMTAAARLGDTAAARRALDRWWALRESPPENSPPQQRLEEASDQLQRAEVLWSAGEVAEVRAILGKVAPEADALLALKPDAKFTQVFWARLLWLKTRATEGLAPAEKRAPLEKAIGMMDKFYAEGRLTRFENEIIRTGIRAELQKLGK
ncbi:MAG: hypothetical protein RL077_5093 [Verrucomicrobiota bacterium]